jgi:hypothetical protein
MVCFGPLGNGTVIAVSSGLQSTTIFYMYIIIHDIGRHKGWALLALAFGDMLSSQ